MSFEQFKPAFVREWKKWCTCKHTFEDHHVIGVVGRCGKRGCECRNAPPVAATNEEE